jgi:hypothetical protein
LRSDMLALRGPESRLGFPVGCELAYRVHASRRRWPHTLFPLFVGFDANATPLRGHFLRVGSAYLFQSPGPLLIEPPFLRHLLRRRFPSRNGQVKRQTAQYLGKVVTERIVVEFRPVKLRKPLRAFRWDAIEKLFQRFADFRGIVLQPELDHQGYVEELEELAEGSNPVPRWAGW